MNREYFAQITSYNKGEFIFINSYLTSLNNSHSSRTKELALAVHLYWLTKGFLKVKNILLFFLIRMPL
jgi:hypothetical protein